MADADRNGGGTSGDPNGVLDAAEGGAGADGGARDEHFDEGIVVTDTAWDAAADPLRVDKGPFVHPRADDVAAASPGADDTRHEAGELQGAVDVTPTGQPTLRAIRGGSQASLRGSRREVPTFRFAVPHSGACADDGSGAVVRGRTGSGAVVHGSDACDRSGEEDAGAVILKGRDPRVLGVPARDADRSGVHR